jgi:hypothetical protein
MTQGRFMSARSRLWLVATLLLGSCATDPAQVNEYLDPQTAVTIRAVAAPFIYARDVPELAANVRDYLSLGAVEVNNMGARKHYLAAVSWSTIDRRRADRAPAPLPDRIELTLAGKTRVLALASHDARSLGIGTPLFRPPSGYLGESWYAVTPADLRAFAAAPPDSIDLATDVGRTSYGLWRRADAAFEDFVRDIPDTATSAAPRR